MGQAEKEIRGSTARLGVLSIPNVMPEATGTPPDSDLTMGILFGVLLVGAEQSLWQANRPYLELFDDSGIEPEEITAILRKGGYSDE